MMKMLHYKYNKIFIILFSTDKIVDDDNISPFAMQVDGGKIVIEMIKVKHIISWV